MITVRVPGTSANLGPGFDCFGLALSIYGKLSFEETESGLSFENVAPEFQNENNLAVRAYRRTLREISAPEKGLFVRIESDIPVSRGLGSSASLLVAGIVAANAAHGYPLDQQAMLNIATELEGHPDNVAPALLGGLTVSLMDDKNIFCMECPVARNVRFCVLVPDFELETKKARAVLPAEIPFRDGCFNAAHSAVLLKALEAGDLKAIGAAMKDRLHQPYRTALINEYEKVYAMAMDCGASAFCISGAGPALMCVYSDRNFGGRMKAAVRSLHSRWRVLPLNVDTQGAVVLEEDEE